MEFKIREDTYNPLLKRKEVRVEVDHDAAGTPTRTDLRKAIATKYNTKTENVYVLDIDTKTGTQVASCAVEVYDDPQTAQRTVPKYIQIRNLPPDERKRVKEELAKKEEAKPKAEKPKPPEKAKTEGPKQEAKEEKPKQEAKPAASPTEAPKKAKDGEGK